MWRSGGRTGTQWLQQDHINEISHSDNLACRFGSWCMTSYSKAISYKDTRLHRRPLQEKKKEFFWGFFGTDWKPWFWQRSRSSSGVKRHTTFGAVRCCELKLDECGVVFLINRLDSSLNVDWAVRTEQNRKVNIKEKQMDARLISAQEGQTQSSERLIKARGVISVRWGNSAFFTPLGMKAQAVLCSRSAAS